MSEVRKIRILVVEEADRQLQQVANLLQENEYDVVLTDIIRANEIVCESLKQEKPFTLAILGMCYGICFDMIGEFGRRLLDIVKVTNIAIITTFPSLIKDREFKPDAFIIESVKSDCTVLETVKRLSVPLRTNNDAQSTVISIWEAASLMSGVRHLTEVSRDFSKDGTEKITAKTHDDRYTPAVLYPSSRSEKAINLSISTSISCLVKCKFCKVHQRKCAVGNATNFFRPLTYTEMNTQIYFAMQSAKFKAALEETDNPKVNINFSGAGDGLRYNLHNCCYVICQLSHVKIPEFSFILTSTGSESKIRELKGLQKRLPRLQHHVSINSLVKKTRTWLMPGVAKCNILKVIDGYEELSEMAEIPTTISWIVIKGINDSAQDAEMIAETLNDRPFRIKLMALAPDSLEGFRYHGMAIKNTTEEDVKKFESLLIQTGVNRPIRIKPIFGSAEKAGCGSTVPSLS